MISTAERRKKLAARRKYLIRRAQKLSARHGMTKSTGIGRGGRRAGGRPKGSKNKRTVLAEVLPRLAAEDQQLPLYRLLDRIADPVETPNIATCFASRLCHFCTPDRDRISRQSRRI
jgi:hypothetical protein